MKPIQRDEIVDYVTYGEQREQIRERILEEKRKRRIHVGEHLTFLFENRDTIRYQIQEMTRAERIVKDADIQHEIDTYNELLGREGEVGCTLLIEIDDAEERAVRLREWLGLPGALYMRLDDGERVRAIFDPRQVGEERLSSVQYLRFDVHGRVPVAIGSDLAGYVRETELTDEQRAALGEDLAG